MTSNAQTQEHPSLWLFEMHGAPVHTTVYTRTGLAAQRRSGPERAAEPRLYHAFEITIRASSMACGACVASGGPAAGAHQHTMSVGACTQAKRHANYNTRDSEGALRTSARSSKRTPQSRPSSSACAKGNGRTARRASEATGRCGGPVSQPAPRRGSRLPTPAGGPDATLTHLI